MAFLQTLLQTPALATAFVVFAIYVLISRIQTWNRLRHIPGPIAASWSRTWLVKSQLGGKLPRDVSDVCEKYGTSSSLPTFILVRLCRLD